MNKLSWKFKNLIVEKKLPFLWNIESNLAKTTFFPAGSASVETKDEYKF
jgi:hypothetical protein